MITVLSAIYGRYDIPMVQPEQDIPVRWVMITDGQVEVPDPWQVFVVERDGMSPRMASRWPKCHAVRYSDGGDPVLWVDACGRIRTPSFVSDCAAALGDSDVAMWTHPHRNTLTAEADAAAALGKYDGQPLHEQVRHYLTEGHPDGFGLWANTCMMWSGAVPDDVGAAWWNEQQEWGSDMDQLAWPVIVRRFGLDVRPFPGSLYDRQMVRWLPHRHNR